MREIGSRIKTLRQDKNMTQEQLAQQLHVTRQAVSSWENRKTQPDLDMLQSLAQALDVSTEELIYGKKKHTFLPFQREEHPMFENIGEKLKNLAVVMTWIGCIISIILGLLISFPFGLLIIAPVGCLLSWVGSFALYGLGQLIENSNQSVDLLRSMAGVMDAPVPEAAPSLQPWKCKACGSYSPAREHRCINCDTPRNDNINAQ